MSIYTMLNNRHWVTLDHVIAMIEAGSRPYQSRSGGVVAQCDYVWSVIVYADKVELRGNGLLAKVWMDRYEMDCIGAAILDRLTGNEPTIH